MSQPVPVLYHQLPVIQEIIANETRLESERRGCDVSPDDPVVRERVCEVVIRIGRELRESILSQISAGASPSPLRIHRTLQSARS